MAEIIPYGTVRTLRACKAINVSGKQILKGLEKMTSDADRARTQLINVGDRLEGSLAHFDEAQQRLQRVQDNYRKTMQEIDEIMSSSPAFQK